MREHVAARLRAEDGISLLEVVIASALVAIIAIGTLTGLEGATATTNENRLRNQAAVIAAASQEALRTEPANALVSLETTPTTKTETVENEHFTVTQEAKALIGATGENTCEATSKEGETSHKGGIYYRIMSTVTWPQQQAAKRKAVSQESIITPPDGSALEVTVTNDARTPEAVSGATVSVDNVPATTGTSGCVLYSAIQATTVSLEVSKTGYITATGASKLSIKEFAIAPNITTQYNVVLAQPGTIEAIFTYKKSTTYEGKEIKSDTFTAYNPGLKTGYEGGGTINSYKAATTSTTTIFPFTEQWQVYAGDCTADDPTTVTSNAVPAPTVLVEGNKTAKVEVPVSHVELDVYNGKSASSPGTPETKANSITITNEACKSSIANNETVARYTHTQKTSGGHLEDPFQPFGPLELCLYASSTKKTYRASYDNTTETTAVNIYLGAGPTGGSGHASEAEVEGIRIKTEQSSC